MIECNIDNMNSEFFEYTMEKLFNAGALDVFMTNIIMKKNRPAVKLSVLSKAKDTDRMCNIIFNETSTIGVRKYQVYRDVLERKIVKIDTIYGCVDVKVAFKEGKIINYSPEYSNVKNAALKTGESIKNIYNETIKKFIEKNL